MDDGNEIAPDDAGEGAGNNRMEEEPAQGGEIHEWSAFYDPEGNIYYYNQSTGESSWDKPEKFNPPPPPDGEEQRSDSQDIQGQAEDEADDVEGRPQEEEPPVDGASGDQQGNWVAYKDDEGREYYFNTVTNETTWDRPDNFETAQEEEIPVEEEQPEPEPSSPERAASPVPTQEYPPSDTDDVTGGAVAGDEDETQQEETQTPEVPVVEEIDPAVKRLQAAEAALNQPDAIMEPGCMNNVTEVVTSQGGNPQKAIQALIESCYGQTAICGLLGRWLADLRTQSASSDSSEQTHLFQNSSEAIRQMAQDVVNRVAKERFTKTGGDGILNLKRSEAGFLELMMESSRWRKLLIDLSATNKDSALLMYCLKEISKRGHHREIARRINQSDHFAVFNAMLASELTVVGKIAVSACRAKDTSIGLDELVGDLRRTCTSTAYTYIYAIEVLRHLVATAKETPFASAVEARASRFHSAIRKWERLTEDLQSAMIDPASSGGSTPLFRKRRLDVALTVSELHQRQRRRLRPADSDQDDGDRALSNADKRSEERTAAVETAVLNFLRRYSLGTQVDDRLLDAMLPKNEMGMESKNLIGKLLIKRPLSVKALLGYLFKPGQRIGSTVMKNKCARLAALAVLAAESEAVAEMQHRNSSQTQRSDEVALTRMLQQGSELCERLENMVSFIVVAGAKGTDSSPGEQLCALAMKCAPVAQGVIVWAREVSKGNDFVTSASYPTVSPSILSLVRIVSLEHPFTRNEALEVALSFLKHSNSEISYQKMNEIKEQSLRLLLFLIVNGEAPTVLERIALLLKKEGSSCMDASLIRYFTAGFLEVVNPPFSVPFVRSLGSFLKAPGCIEAIRSQYFGNDNKENMSKLIRTFREMSEKGSGQGQLTPHDAALVKSLVSAYSS